MLSNSRSPEQRDNVRFQPKTNIYAAIQANNFEDLGIVADLNGNGVGFLSVQERKLTDKFLVLDLVSDTGHFILRSLTARVIFTSDTVSQDEMTSFVRRYGLKFVNLSALQKRQLDLVTRKYTLAK